MGVKLDIKERAGGGDRCPFCFDDLGPDPVACAKCAVRLHRPCWQEVQACPTAGCGAGRPVGAPRSAAADGPLPIVTILALLGGLSWIVLRLPPGPGAPLPLPSLPSPQIPVASPEPWPPGPDPLAPSFDPDWRPPSLGRELRPGRSRGSDPVAARSLADLVCDRRVEGGRRLSALIELQALGVGPDDWGTLAALATLVGPHDLEGFGHLVEELLARDAPHALRDANALRSLHGEGGRVTAFAVGIRADDWPPDLAASYYAYCLDNGDSQARELAAQEAWAWLQVGRREAASVVRLVRAFGHALADRQVETRRRVAGALAGLGPLGEPAHPDLLRALRREGDPVVQERLVQALERGGWSGLQGLIGLAQDPREAQGLRVLAIWALGRHERTAEARRALQRIVTEEQDGEPRSQAQAALDPARRR